MDFNNNANRRPAVRAFSTTSSEAARETKQRELLRQQQARVETTEKYSGLRIKNRLVASLVLEDKFSDLRFTRISDLRHDINGRWATAGVLVDKCVKQAASGQSYSVWKLGDLSPADNTVTVFLFGQAHADWYREPEGTIWAVIDGKLREDGGTAAGDGGGGGGKFKSDRPTLACDHPSNVLKLGTSPDFARCKGTRRDGKNCTMHVNVNVSEYCAFHASAALKSLTTERMALGPGRAPKFVQNGRTVMGSKGIGSRPNVPPQQVQRDRNLRGIHVAADDSTRQVPARDATDEERQRRGRILDLRRIN